MVPRRAFLRAATLAGGAAMTGQLHWDSSAFWEAHGRAGANRDTVHQAQPPRPAASGKAFIMDVHVHMGDRVSGISQEQMLEFRKDLYRPWTHIYDGEGKRIPRREISTPAVEDLIALMDRDGIDVSVIMPSDHRRVASVTDKVSQKRATSNDFIAEIARKYPNRLIAIAGHDPLRDQWNAAPELERCVKELGMRGMKLYPPYDQFDPYDERLFPVYEKAIELDVPLTFHTGWTPLLTGPLEFARPEPLDKVGIRYPDLKVNLAHVGGPAYWHGALITIGRHQNFTCDLSSWCTYPPQMLVEMLNLARDLVGLERVLFGSEHTLCPPGEFVELLRNINHFGEIYRFPPFDTREIDAMLGLNAARLYKWDIK